MSVRSLLPLNVRIRVERVVLDHLEQRTKIVLRGLRIMKNISALLAVDLGDTIEERTLQAECHWSVRVDDRVTSFPDIDVEDLLLVHLGGGGVRADGCDKPRDS